MLLLFWDTTKGLIVKKLKNFFLHIEILVHSLVVSLLRSIDWSLSKRTTVKGTSDDGYGDT